MYFDSSNSYKDSPLETWSPYRASDQVALISMPNKMVSKKSRFQVRKYFLRVLCVKDFPLLLKVRTKHNNYKHTCCCMHLSFSENKFFCLIRSKVTILSICALEKTFCLISQLVMLSDILSQKIFSLLKYHLQL